MDREGNEALFELWLSDPDFCLAYKEHYDWVAMLEDEMDIEREILSDLINENDASFLEQCQRTLQAREKKIYAKIEVAATKLGL